MNIIEKYLYIASPLQNDTVRSKSFIKMKSHGWYRDSRGSQNFEILNKRFQIDDNWYRVMVRFRKISSDKYKIDMPIPFVITETETKDGIVFIDRRVLHGRKVKHALGYISEGIPMTLIDMVIQELKEYLIFI